MTDSKPRRLTPFEAGNLLEEMDKNGSISEKSFWRNITDGNALKTRLIQSDQTGDVVAAVNKFFQADILMFIGPEISLGTSNFAGNNYTLNTETLSQIKRGRGVAAVTV